MSDNVVTFTLIDIPRDDWNNFVNKIDRKFYNEKRGVWENMPIEEYLRKLVHRLSQLSREDIANIIKNNKIIIEEKK